MWLPLLALPVWGSPCGTPSPIPDRLLDEVHARFPEQRDVVGRVSAGGYHLAIGPAQVGAELSVALVSDGEAFRDRFGWFVYDPARLPLEGVGAIVEQGTLWEDASVVAGPSATCRTARPPRTLVMDPTWVGLELGFWVQTDGFVRQDGPTFFSVDALNAVIDPVASHVRVEPSLYDAPTLWLGFENHFRDGPEADHDANDVVVRLTSSDPAWIRGAEIAQGAEDRDGDGVPDAFDDSPDDPDRALVVRSPAGLDVFTYAFEASTPFAAQADHNDVVAGASFHEVLDGQGRVVALDGRLQVVARDAAEADTSFWLWLEGLPSASWTVRRVDGDGRPVGQDQGDHPGGTLGLDLFPRLGEALVHANQRGDDVAHRGHVARFHVVFDRPVDPSALVQAPYAAQLQRTVPGPVELRVLPTRWDPPAEGVPLNEAYPLVGLWERTDGAEIRDWYRVAGIGLLDVPSTLWVPEL